MNRLKTLLAALLITTAAPAADSVPLFNAVLTMGQEHRFVLTTTAGASSAWLRLGEAWQGYTLKSFDEKAGVLELTSPAGAHAVRLVNASVGEAASVTPATLADAEDVLRAMRFEEMLAKILEQQKQAMAPMLEQSVARSRVPEEHRERFMALQRRILDETFATLAGPEMQSDMAKVYSEIFSKEELTALGAFYVTPAGQSMIDKQPDVQQRMMQLMMPKMAELGPRMQQMQQEFRAEIAAEKQAAPAAPNAPAVPPAPAK